MSWTGHKFKLQPLVIFAIIRSMKKALTSPKGIVIKTEVRFGQPTIAGTRIAVADILNLVQAGYRIDEIPRQYPGITVKAAKRALGYAARLLGKEEVLAISA